MGPRSILYTLGELSYQVQTLLYNAVQHAAARCRRKSQARTSPSTKAYRTFRDSRITKSQPDSIMGRLPYQKEIDDKYPDGGPILTFQPTDAELFTLLQQRVKEATAYPSIHSLYDAQSLHETKWIGKICIAKSS